MGHAMIHDYNMRNNCIYHQFRKGTQVVRYIFVHNFMIICRNYVLWLPYFRTFLWLLLLHSSSTLNVTSAGHILANGRFKRDKKYDDADDVLMGNGHRHQSINTVFTHGTYLSVVWRTFRWLSITPSLWMFSSKLNNLVNRCVFLFSISSTFFLNFTSTVLVQSKYWCCSVVCVLLVSWNEVEIGIGIMTVASFIKGMGSLGEWYSRDGSDLSRRMVHHSLIIHKPSSSSSWVCSLLLWAVTLQRTMYLFVFFPSSGFGYKCGGGRRCDGDHSEYILMKYNHTFTLARSETMIFVSIDMDLSLFMTHALTLFDVYVLVKLYSKFVFCKSLSHWFFSQYCCNWQKMSKIMKWYYNALVT